MLDAVKRLLAYLDSSGTGDAKLDRIKSIVDENPTIGVASLVERMAEVGLPPGTIIKAARWMDDPTIVLPKRVRKTRSQLISEGLGTGKVFDAEPS